jgi:tRNA-2-methylthio-N6-dimethylallyladenosine synthase
MPGPSVYIETYGCQMNVLDSELVTSQLAGQGYRVVDRPEGADVVLLNTCSVRELSEQKVWSQLGRLTDSRQVVGVIGCMAEREGTNILKRMPQVDLLCGPSSLDQLPALLQRAFDGETAQVALAGHSSRRSKTLEAAADGLETLDLSRAFSPSDGTSQAYVRITRGCNKFCSFCVVPYTRGPEVHRPPEHIVEEVRGLARAGVLEVTLLGQTVNHYEWPGCSFAALLRRVHDEVPELPRLRFLTSYPRDFTDEALDVMASSPRICRYLHIPAQSGSNRLLGLMNRGYTVEEYLSLVERARVRMPDVRLVGDIITGFPTETDEDHRATVSLLEAVRYKSVFVFKYSPREGTVAERRLADDVPDDVKRARNLELLEVQGRISLENLQSLVGRELEVIVEGTSKLRKHTDDAVVVGWEKRRSLTRLVGRTRGDEIVAFDGPADLVGRIVSVRATGATQLTIHGELVPTQKETAREHHDQL